MKKIIFLSLSILLLCGCNSNNNEENTTKDDTPKEYESILDYGDYKSIKSDNIETITKIRYTEGGDQREEITSESDITGIYNMIRNLKVGEKVEMACDDNTTVYSFNLKDGNKYSIEIECDWFVINGKRYNIVN